MSMRITTEDLVELDRQRDKYCTCAWDTDEHDHSKACPVTLISELRAAADVVQTAQGILTALNVGDVHSGSMLHLRLREVMIAYRAVANTEEGGGDG